ncbi:NADPH-dependent FMN reductase [Jiella pelagia]|uniref:NAD(P)H-dependent oxidoreductase n=1 Tax=Jiella pelagia TaxID=2986949 RepID=A0ABY7C4J4_9HYPH|nr:NADPH-dependent FMN reductase [Jiella pelagia]WAP68750.1 NAD(P)H-dependent oxidoreductase [Jiella pelagia]
MIDRGPSGGPARPRLLAICGSLRRASTNRILLEAFARHGATSAAIEMAPDLATIPPFNPDREGAATPAAVSDFASQVAAADGLIIAAPEYAHGIPGALKNALDWLVSRSEIPGKPVMLVHASTRGAHVRDHLCEVLRTMSVRLFEREAFEMHLIGKPVEDARAMLGHADQGERIRAHVAAFADFAAHPGRPSV